MQIDMTFPLLFPSKILNGRAKWLVVMLLQSEIYSMATPVNEGLANECNNLQVTETHREISTSSEFSLSSTELNIVFCSSLFKTHS